MTANNKEIYANLNNQGYRVTKARGKILAILSKSTTHLYVDDIFLAIKARGEKVSKIHWFTIEDHQLSFTG